MRTDSNGPPRKTLASQLDRLDGILDGLDSALAGAVQEAVSMAVKQAVQAVLTEVLSNRQLQEQLQQTARHAAPPQQMHHEQGMANRLWQATTQGLRRTVYKVKQLGRGAGMALVSAGAVLAGIVYAARKRIASVATAVYQHGKRVLLGAISVLTRFLPSYALGS
jgi:hypothetical protein